MNVLPYAPLQIRLAHYNNSNLTCSKNGRSKNWQKTSDAQKVEGKGGEEVRECDGRTGLRNRKEWEEAGEQQQKAEGDGDEK